jgi:pSer/pThr/pTyr-binding forkhead associated (FHA) protein
MKADSHNNGQEISTTKLNLNVLDYKKKVGTESNAITSYPNNNNKNLNLKNAENGKDENDNDYGICSLNTVEQNYATPLIIEQLKKIVDTADLLEIEVINSSTLQRGLKIEINSLGMTSNSERKAYDGYTFFGYSDKNEIDNLNENNEEEVNEEEKQNLNNDLDFVLVQKEDNNPNEKNIGRHFRIRFDLKNMGYFIKDLGRGYGTFQKIMGKSKIKDSNLINIGNSYIVCTFGVDEYDVNGGEIANADKILNIKVFSETPVTEPYFFNPQQYKLIYIGRDISCHIVVDDTLLSRYHCIIEYDEEDGEWYIRDGKVSDDLTEIKPSTNGSWLYLIDETPINDGMIFKSNHNVYECHIIKQKK